MRDINILVLEERIKNLDIQIKRCIAHIESEQRVLHIHEQRIESSEKWINRMQLEVDAHEKILFNGEGLTIKMDRLTQYMQKQEELLKVEKAEIKAEKDKFQWTLPNIIAVLSLVATIILGLMVFMKG